MPTAPVGDTGQWPGFAAGQADEGFFGQAVGGLDLVGGDVGGLAGGADRGVVDDPVTGARGDGHHVTPLAGCARSAGFARPGPGGTRTWDGAVPAARWRA